MKTILILSGGMDSSTLLYYLLEENHLVEALTFNYNQRHRKEIDCARELCKENKVNHQVIDLSNITHLISNSSLTGDIDVPEGHYQEESMRLTVVPNRNMIMLAIAIGYAENIKFDSVSIANHAGDHHIYPDCRPEFINYLGIASKMGTYNQIGIYSPFCNLTKNEVALLGRYLGVPYEKTWTCYRGGVEPCNRCGSCVERNEALDYAWRKYGEHHLSRILERLQKFS